MTKTIALIFGGEGAEKSVSEKSAAALAESLTGKINLLKIGIDPNGNWFLFDGDTNDIRRGEWLKSERLTPVFPARFKNESGFYKENGERIDVDMAFPILHGDFGEDGKIQGALNTAHINYLGSSVTASAITEDKAYTKIIAEYLSIPTLPWFIPSSKSKNEVRKEAERRFGYPFFIKPRALGSSIGASAVYSKKDFDASYELAMKSSDGFLMIETLAGIKCELEFALFDDGKRRFISRAGAVYSGGFYDFDSKYSNTDRVRTATRGFEDKKAEKKARAYARKIADFLSLGNLSRVDFFYTVSGEIYFNEINSIPGTTETSLYPKLVKEYGSFKSSFLEEFIND